MKCPACGYVSFDKPDRCRKCGADLVRPEGENPFTLSVDPFEPEDMPAPAPHEAAPRVPSPPEQKKPAAATPPPAPPQEASPPPAPRQEPPPPPRRRRPSHVPPAAPVEAPPAAPAAKEEDSVFESFFDKIFDEPPAAPPPPPEAAVPDIGEVELGDLSIDLEEPHEQAPVSLVQGQTEAEPEFTFPATESPAPIERLEEVPTAFKGERPAPFLRRAGAFVIDSAVVAATALPFAAGAGVALAARGARASWLLSHTWYADAWIPFSLLILLISAVYFVWSLGAGGRTVGKRLLGLRVVGAAGEPLTVPASLARWLGYLLSAVPLGLGFWWALVDREGLAWHDRLSRSMVVEETA